MRALREASSALHVYAAILGVCHALTGLAWFAYKNVATLVTGEDCVCWPVIPGCGAIRSALSEGGARAAVWLYVALGLLSAALYLARRARAATGAFLAATLLGTAIYALDYRLRLNQTYMLGCVVVAFFAAPKKPQVLQALVALFYFWAGTLKANREWLSGAALYAKPWLVPDALIPASCAYVLLLEMVLVWGLFAPRAWVRWCVYAQLLVFHAASWPVVGWFYPLLMLGLTAIYPLVWALAPEETLTWATLRSDRGTLRPVLATCALFSALQLVPLAFPGDTALTGEGRLFALHMFDARVECEGGATLESSAGLRSHLTLINDHLDTRTRCDPIVLLATAKRVCPLLANRPDRVRVDVTIDAKRTTGDALQPLVRIDDLCNREIDYSPWRHNAWIEAR
ncbi:MAG TPA: hypothetical protein VGI39_36475 [Polyangiaceae bacterium]|jgi:hypothetical protein